MLTEEPSLTANDVLYFVRRKVDRSFVISSGPRYGTAETFCDNEVELWVTYLGVTNSDC
jgi:hypothetical protein